MQQEVPECLVSDFRNLEEISDTEVQRESGNKSDYQEVLVEVINDSRRQIDFN